MDNTSILQAPDLLPDDALLDQEQSNSAEVLAFIEQQVDRALAGLSLAQRKQFSELCRAVDTQQRQLATRMHGLCSDFDSQAQADLVAALKASTGLEINLTNYLHTDHIERDLATRRETVRTHSRTLWDAAKANIGYEVAWETGSGLEYLDNSSINDSSHPNNGTPSALSVRDFYKTVRSLDLGERMNQYLQIHLPANKPDIQSLCSAQLQLALLEAQCTQNAGLNASEASTLQALISDPQAHWTLHDIEANDERLTLPFYTLQVADQGAPVVYSFFPMRPGGALRRHFSVAQAQQALTEQIKASAEQGDFQWLFSLISMADRARLLDCLKPTAQQEPPTSWLGLQLKNAFAAQAPDAPQLTVVTGNLETYALEQSLTHFYLLTLHADLRSQFVPTAVIDKDSNWRALLAVFNESLEMLTLPLAGSVTGLGKLVLTVTLGALAYQTVKAGYALARGQTAEAVQAAIDLIDLIASIRLQGVAVRLSSKRQRHLLGALAHPRWGLNAQGVHTLHWPTRAANPRPVAPHYPSTTHLRTHELLEKMLPNSLRGLPPARIQTAIGLARARREDLGQIWAGQGQSSWPLLHALKVEKLRHSIDQLSEALHNTQALPDIADRALPALLPGIMDASIEVYDPSGALLLHYRSSGPAADHTLAFTRVQSGQYQPRENSRAQPAPLLETALAEHERLRPGSDLGRIGDFTVDNQFANRAQVLQQRVSRALLTHESALFEALSLELPAEQLSPAHQAYALVADAGLEAPAPPAPELKLREQFPELAATAARQLLRDAPELTELPARAALPEHLAVKVHSARQQNRIIDTLSALQDPKGRGLNLDAEALLCHLLTLLPGWPEALGIQVRSATQAQRSYGAPSATQYVTLVENAGHYGWVNAYDDIEPPRPGHNSLVSSALQALTDQQRDAIGYDLDGGGRLSQLVISSTERARQLLFAGLKPLHTSFTLGPGRLAHFRQAVDLTGSVADNQGIYTLANKRYIEHDSATFQVLHDREASTPVQPVWRIVHPDDSVANDPDNVYVVTRPGRSEPVVRSPEKGWLGVLAGGLGGMPRRSRALEADIRLQTQLVAATQELLDWEIKVDSLAKQLTPRAEKINERLDEAHPTALEKVEWAVFRGLVERMTGFREEKLKLYEQHRALFKKEPEYASTHAFDEAQCHAQILADCSLVVITLHLEHLERLAPLGPFSVTEVPSFRQHCLEHIRALSLKLPYADRTQSILEKLKDTPYAEFASLRDGVVASRPANPYYTRAALCQFRLWLLSIGDPVNPSAAATPSLALTELATTLRCAALTLKATEELPAQLQINVLDTLQRQFERGARELQILGETFTEPREVAHLKATAELIAYFEQFASQRLQQRYDAATTEAELQRNDDEIDFDFIPQRPGTSSGPTQPPKKLVRYKIRGRHVTVIGTARKEQDELYLDVESQPMDAAGPPNPVYKKTQSGPWTAGGTAEQSPGVTLEATRLAARNAVDAVASQKAEADAMVKRYDPISIVERLEQHAQRADQLHEKLRGSGDSNDTALLSALTHASQTLQAYGQRLKLALYKNPDVPDLNRLRYLLDNDQVQVTAVQVRKPLGKGAGRHFLDTYRIDDRENGKPLWVAHFHYASKDADKLAFEFKGGHLKTLAQEHQGAEHQAQQEREGKAITPIWRVAFDPANARRLFDKLENR